MPRIMIKGGVWRNTEDEILKVAVSKYGVNQWSRVASLIHRKSAKQCKARWNEWLDPSIKKTEWSREETEKLLHLAKILPTQWRTIARMVGRTASQCLEQYELLLDQAQRKEEGDEAGPSGVEDPRRLRPGEIDPCPETKPARPDPQDMDQDELEMLNEARARLANTQGKKAKRKAREKQLEEARRLAALQKRRELRMAGIEVGIGGRKQKRGLDYNVEIPFEKPVPVGNYDTANERDQAKGFNFKRLRQDHMDGARRNEIEEAQRKKDKERQKRDDQIVDPSKIVDSLKPSRPKLVLPEPTMTDNEAPLMIKLAPDVGAIESLRKIFSQLPKPKNDYVAVDDEDATDDPMGDDDEAEQKMIPDQAHVEEQARQQEEQRLIEEFKRKSSAVQKNLPRPVNIPATSDEVEAFKNQIHAMPTVINIAAMKEIRLEMLRLLHRDALCDPTDEQIEYAAQKSKARVPIDMREVHKTFLEDYPCSDSNANDVKPESLDQAHRLIQEQIELDGAKRYEEFNTLFQQQHDELMSRLEFDPNRCTHDLSDKIDETNRIRNHRLILDSLRAEFERVERRTKKAEKRHKVLMGGYEAKAKEIRRQMCEDSDKLLASTVELNTLTRLASNEHCVVQRRCDKLAELVEREKERERQLQSRYDNLMLLHSTSTTSASASSTTTALLLKPPTQSSAT